MTDTKPLRVPKEGWRTKPVYTIAQAAKLAGTTPSTVRRWLFGYHQPGHRMAPVLGPDRQEALLSFLDLIEVIVVAAFRQRDIPLDRLRRAHKFAADVLGLQYPFATLRFKTDGAHVLHQFDAENPDGPLLALDRGQWVLPGTVVESIEKFDYTRTWVARWFPEGKAVPIVVDPRISAGKPTVVHRGVTVETLYRRWKAGQSVEFIAADFQLPRDTIAQVLECVARHEERYAA